MLKTLVWERRDEASQTGNTGKRGHGHGGDAAHANGHFRQLDDPTQISDLLADHRCLIWLDLMAPSHEELQLIAEEFALHPLAVEDAAKHSQRPKIEDYDTFYFMVVFALEGVDLEDTTASLPSTAISAGRFIIHEIDVFIGQRFLITVHDAELPLIDQMVERWRRNSRAIHEGIGVLLYTLLDGIVDAYFPVLDGMVERVEEMEMALFTRGAAGGQTYDTRRLFQVKRDLLQLRQVIAPQRDALLVLARREVPLFDRKVAIYFQDVYDHVVRVTDTIDVYQELLNNALQSYLSVMSNDLNQVMKTLTALTLMMMVPTLIAGVYGMNFEHMPELASPYGYPFALGLMALSAALLFLFFRRKRWL